MRLIIGRLGTRHGKQLAYMLNQLSASQLSNLLQRGEVSNRDVMQSVLSRIESIEPSIGAFISLRERSTLLWEADQIDARRCRGESIGPLAGLPIAVKDNICTKGLRTTCASKILEHFIPPYDATVIERIQSADGIVLGKTNMDEFAMGSSTENSAFKTTRNPHNTDYVPGGTSGGSAAAVAADETILAIGSDTGGSVRQPAAYCGVVGLKPTYGRVSRYGLIAYASSLDQIGVITKSVDDAALLLSVISGHDPLDATSIPGPGVAKTFESDSKVRRIGIPAEYFSDAVEVEVRTAAMSAVEILKAHGYETMPITLPHTRYAIPVYYIVASAEASSNLARYAGMLYGYRSAQAESLRDLIVNSRTEGFGQEVRRRILLGTFVLSAGYYESYYGKANRVRTLIRRDFDSAFRDCDVILTPVAPGPAFKIGEKTTDPLKMYLVDILSVTANLTGLPAITVPCGRSATGLPLAVQFTGPALSEQLLLDLARHVESHFPRLSPSN